MFMQAANRCKYLLTLATLFIALSAQSGFAQSTTFSYQGRLTDAGNPANDSYDLQFKLFDTLAGGTQQGATLTRNAVVVSAGVFTVTLDFGASVFGGADRFLEISVRPAGGGAFTTLNLRQGVTSTPYAIQTLNAQQLGGLPASSFVRNTTTQQAGANLNISGNGTMTSLNVNGPASFGGVAAPAVAPAGQGRLYFDAGSNKLRVSENGGAFVNLVGTTGIGGSGTANTIPLWSAGTTLGNSVITQSAADDIGIGTASPTLGKLQVVSSTGTGVFGLTSSNSDDDAGVYGRSSAIGGKGVIGEAFGPGSYGVRGLSDEGTGVNGSSVSSIGVIGTSITGTGVAGISNSCAAVFGSGTSFFRGDTHPLNSSYGRGIAIGFNPNTTVGHIFAYDYGASQAQSLVLNHLGGNVGIGTATPTERLTVRTATGSYGLLHTDGTISVGSYVGGSDTAGWYGTRSNHPLHFFAANSGPRLTITTAGLVGIGTTTPDQLLSVNGGASKPGGGSWFVFSDKRLKNIQGRYTAGLNAILQLQPIRYEYKPDNDLGLPSSDQHIGFSAQALQQIIPEAVTQDSKGYLLVNNDPILWTMLNAVKEQHKLIEQLQARLARLERGARRRAAARQPVKVPAADSRK